MRTAFDPSSIDHQVTARQTIAAHVAMGRTVQTAAAPTAVAQPGAEEYGVITRECVVVFSLARPHGRPVLPLLR